MRKKRNKNVETRNKMADFKCFLPWPEDVDGKDQNESGQGGNQALDNGTRTSLAPCICNTLQQVATGCNVFTGKAWTASPMLPDTFAKATCSDSHEQFGRVLHGEFAILNLQRTGPAWELNLQTEQHATPSWEWILGSNMTSNSQHLTTHITTFLMPWLHQKISALPQPRFHQSVCCEGQQEPGFSFQLAAAAQTPRSCGVCWLVWFSHFDIVA